jgi:hypothetical protein
MPWIANMVMISESWRAVSVQLIHGASIRINEDKTRAVYFSHRLTLNERNIPSVNHVKYLRVIFDKRITWRFHIEMTEVKTFRTFISIYSLFKSKQLSTNIKLPLYRVLIRSAIAYACSSWEFAADTLFLKFISSLVILKLHPSPICHL